MEWETESEPLTFEELRRLGMEYVQELSGQVWTDFNLHDPGVTILEQVCYALTDLAFRSGYDVADILTKENGTIDYKGLGLYLPGQILSCRPVTPTDYRKLILDAEHRIDAVFIESFDPKSGEDVPQGRYRIRVKPGYNQTLTRQTEDEIIHCVSNIYHRHRNLCEDLARVELIPVKNFSLHAVINLTAGAIPERVLAQIYVACARIISPRPVFQAPGNLPGKEMDLEKRFEGPLLMHGYLDDQDLWDKDRIVTQSDITARVMSIEGIKSIVEIRFGEAADPEPVFDYTAALLLPETPEEIYVTLQRDKTVFPISFSEFKYELNKLFGTDKKIKTLQENTKGNDAPPKGNYRNIENYYSIQNHFPDIYGINRFGIPKSESRHRKAAARQLKAYLSFFEQAMADFLTTLAHVPGLFSLDPDLDPVAWYTALKEDVIPNGQSLYLSSKQAAPDKTLQHAVNAQVDFQQKRNTILDFLLAMYGESLVQPKIPCKDRQIRNKTRFLRQVDDISKNRGAAANLYDTKHPTATSGIEKKVRMLMDLDPDIKFYLMEHILLWPAQAFPEAPAADFFSNRVSVVFCEIDFEEPQILDQFTQAFDLNCPAHILFEFRKASPEDMEYFEKIKTQWLKEKQKNNSRQDEVDVLAWKLVSFLQEIEKYS